jgi:four helix bundle protein
MEIVLTIYTITRYFPKDELYCLVSQMRRAAITIPSNIAEGFNRSQKGEYRRFLRIALDSNAELETQIEIACRLNYLTDGDRDIILDKLDFEPRMITNLTKKLDETIIEQRVTSNEYKIR